MTWMIGTSPNADLVNFMLDKAVRQPKSDKHLIVHVDRGDTTAGQTESRE